VSQREEPLELRVHAQGLPWAASAAPAPVPTAVVSHCRTLCSLRRTQKRERRGSRHPVPGRSR
jgi:hypothetical protein